MIPRGGGGDRGGDVGRRLRGEEERKGEEGAAVWARFARERGAAGARGLGQLAIEMGYARWETERWAMLVSGGASDAEREWRWRAGPGVQWLRRAHGGRSRLGLRWV